MKRPWEHDTLKANIAQNTRYQRWLYQRNGWNLNPTPGRRGLTVGLLNKAIQGAFSHRDLSKEELRRYRHIIVAEWFPGSDGSTKNLDAPQCTVVIQWATRLNGEQIDAKDAPHPAAIKEMYFALVACETAAQRAAGASQQSMDL